LCAAAGRSLPLCALALGCGAPAVSKGETPVEAGASNPTDSRDAACPGGGSALWFDGIAAWVGADLGADLPTGNRARTVEAWVYTRATSWAVDAHTIFEYGSNVTRQAFAIDPDPYPTMQFYTWNDDLFVNTGLAAEGWFHVAATYDGSTLHGFINGVEKGSHTFTAPLATTETPINIGRSLRTMAHFDGLIDEVRIWNVARTPAQIAQTMYVRVDGDEPGLVAAYHFDEGAGTTAHDAASGHHDATLMSGPTWVPSPVALRCP
jgi:hypothetical protein